MELIIAIIVLVAFDMLAMRFGVDSRTLQEDAHRRPDAVHAQI